MDLMYINGYTGNIFIDNRTNYTGRQVSNTDPMSTFRSALWRVVFVEEIHIYAEVEVKLHRSVN